MIVMIAYIYIYLLLYVYRHIMCYHGHKFVSVLLEVTLEEQNAALQQRLGELESDMLQFQSNFLDHIHRASWQKWPMVL